MARWKRWEIVIMVCSYMIGIGFHMAYGYWTVELVGANVLMGELYDL
jgi:hypothetical protein